MSKKGTSTFVMQRASATLMIPLAIWFLVSLVAHAGDSFTEMRAWLSNPFVSVPFALLIVVGAYHGRIGLEEIITDYIHSGMRSILLLLTWTAAIALMAIALYAAFLLSFTG